jgi:hypothetical protein
MGYYTSICHGTITSAMNEDDDIYTALRSALSAKTSPLMNIIVWDPLREGKVRLHFEHLREGSCTRSRRSAKPVSKGRVLCGRVYEDAGPFEGRLRALGT